MINLHRVPLNEWIKRKKWKKKKEMPISPKRRNIPRFFFFRDSSLYLYTSPNPYKKEKRRPGCWKNCVSKKHPPFLSFTREPRSPVFFTSPFLSPYFQTSYPPNPLIFNQYKVRQIKPLFPPYRNIRAYHW